MCRPSASPVPAATPVSVSTADDSHSVAGSRRSDAKKDSPIDDKIEGRTFRQRWIYRTVRASARIVGVNFFDLRCFGRHHIDFPGAAVLLSTHQSTLDPVMIGMMGNKELSYLARKTLFKSPIFAGLIRALNAIEIDRESGGLAGLKETLKRLKRGHKVLLFPEGTRTSTGQPAQLKPGFIALARRGRVPLVPMAVTGAFHALKRGSMLPTYAPLCVYLSERIEADQVAAWNDDELLAEISKRLLACHHAALEQTLRSSRLKY